LALSAFAEAAFVFAFGDAALFAGAALAVVGVGDLLAPFALTGLGAGAFAGRAAAPASALVGFSTGAFSTLVATAFLLAATRLLIDLL